jgi:hypothetical protein
MENLDFIWRNYGIKNVFGKICVVFDFDKLKKKLNSMLRVGNARISYNGVVCRQIFSINYGLVGYVERTNYRENAERLPNPIRYTYLKDKIFSNEQEIRISLSAIGVGQFILDNGSVMNFPNHLKLSFDFRDAIVDGTIKEILLEPHVDTSRILSKLAELRIFPKPGSSALNTSVRENSK